MFVPDSYTRTVINCVGLFFVGKTRTFYSRKEYMKKKGWGVVEKRQAKMIPIKILFVSWKIILCRIFWVSFYDHFH